MKKAIKKLSIALCCILAVGSFTALAACNKTNTCDKHVDADGDGKCDNCGVDYTEPAPAQAAITDGYYKASLNGMLCYYHFTTDGSYYGSAFDGGMTDAGTYEVVNKAIEYYAELDDWSKMGDGAEVVESSKTTSEKAVVLTSYKDGSVQEIAFANDKLCDFHLMGQSQHMTLSHDATYNYVAADMEVAIAIRTFYYDSSSDNTLTLYHDKTYKDYTGLVGGSGTWVQTSTGFTLTKSDSTVITLTENEEGVIYASGSTEEQLTLEAKVEGSVEFVATDVHIDGIMGMTDGTDGTIKVVAANDVATLVLDLPAIGQSGLEIDYGTYTVDNSGMFPSYAFEFEKVGTLTSSPDYSTATASSIGLNLAITADGTKSFLVMAGAPEMNLEFTATAKYTYTIVTEVANLVNDNVAVSNVPGFNGAATATMNLILKSDGSVKLTCDILGQTGLVFDEGSYVMDTTSGPLPSYTFECEKVTIVAAPDYATASASGISFNVTVTPKEGATFLGDMIPGGAALTFEATFVLTYTIG